MGVGEKGPLGIIIGVFSSCPFKSHILQNSFKKLYYKLNLTCQNSYDEILSPNVMTLGRGALERWLCHEDWSPYKTVPRELPSPSALSGHKKKDWLGSRLSPDTKAACTMILNFLASIIVRNKHLLFIHHFFHGILLQCFEYMKTSNKR